MLATVGDAIDDGPYTFAGDARVQRRGGAYHEAFEVHNHVFLQVGEVLHGPRAVNIPVFLVSIIVEPEFGVGFVEGMH